jgi:small ubiquitin-related modifier
MADEPNNEQPQTEAGASSEHIQLRVLSQVHLRLQLIRFLLLVVVFFFSVPCLLFICCINTTGGEVISPFGVFSFCFIFSPIFFFSREAKNNLAPFASEIDPAAQDGNEVHFKIKKSTPLRKLMDAFCQRQAINPTSIRFLYDGKRVNETQTPKELEMEDNDVIDAVLQQTGGW